MSVGRIVWEGTIVGEPCSKSNRSKIGFCFKRGGGKRPIIRKSDDAEKYIDAFKAQAPFVTRNKAPYQGHVSVEIRIAYTSWRPDLDESQILDCLQGHAYENDRQIVEKHVWRLPNDRTTPRAEIIVRAIEESA